MKNFAVPCLPDWKENISMTYSGFIVRYVNLWQRNILNDYEKARLTSLCYKFGEMFFVYFSMKALTRKIHELASDFPGFANEHGAVGFVSEEEVESLDHEINLKFDQWSYVRSEIWGDFDLQGSGMSNIQRLTTTFLHQHQGNV